MKRIPLTKGQYAIVDDEDFEWLSQWKWHALKTSVTYYACHRNRQKYLFMHRIITNCPKDSQVDHRNGNGLDNRRDNLRFSTQQQNTQNQRPIKGGTSKYKGVYWDKTRKKWAARITCGYKNHFLGRYKTELEAVHSYDKAALKYFGEFACPNFLEKNK